MKLYEWTPCGRNQLETRIYCPKCGQSKHVTIVDKQENWDVEYRSQWVAGQCDKCKGFLTFKKRREGVTVKTDE